MIKQLFRFGVVGLIAAVVHLSIVIFMVRTWAILPLIANVFGFAISFQISYWGHRLWTFNNAIVLHSVAFPRLFLTQVIGFSANESLFYIFLTFNLPYPLALAIVLVVLPIFTFISSKLWVFR